VVDSQGDPRVGTGAPSSRAARGPLPCGRRGRYPPGSGPPVADDRRRRATPLRSRRIRCWPCRAPRWQAPRACRPSAAASAAVHGDPSGRSGTWTGCSSWRIPPGPRRC